MNQKLIIPKIVTTEILEKLLVDINHEQLDLQVPIKIEYRGFGILPFLFLVLFTWMRKTKGTVIIPIKAGNEDEFKGFANDYYGYIILSTFWRHCNIVNEDGVGIRDSFKKHTALMHQYIDSLSGELPNESILIPCFDHYSEEKGHPHWFYINSEFAGSPLELDNTVYQILTKLTLIYKSRILRNVKDSFDSIRRIVWELVKNTDEHAVEDYLGKTKPLPNTRGLLMRIHRSSKSNFISKTTHKGLKEYYSSALPDSDYCFILEISVFDSGSGLVKNFLKDKWSYDMTITEEVSTVRKCLIKGQTSVTTYEGNQKGMGLDEVLKLLGKKDGFLSIRSGRVSLYRDLIKSPYKITQDPYEVELYDWITCEKDNYTKMENSEGTLITLAYPLN